MGTTNKQLALNVTKIILILLGAAGLGGYSYTNHSKSERGYALLADAVNQSVLYRLDRMEDRLDALERKPVAASQPRVVLPAPSSDPYGDLRKELRASTHVVRYPPTAKAPTSKAPPVRARVPAKLQDVW